MDRRASKSFAIVAIAAAAAAAAAQAPASPTLEQLGNLAYVGVGAAGVELRGGTWVGPPFVPGGVTRPRVQLVRSLYAIGDLDSDRLQDAVVLLTEEAGGSGTMVSLAAVAYRDGALRNVATRAIGERVQVRTLDIDGRQVVMRVVMPAAGDPVCCPTLKRRLVFALDGGQLVERASTTEGQVSLADLEGITWRLLRARDDRDVAAAQVPQTARFERGRVSGSAGCNRFMGPVAMRDARLKIGPLAGTRMACDPAVDSLEQAYYAALANASAFAFSFGRLAIRFEGPAGPDTLFFEAER